MDFWRSSILAVCQRLYLLTSKPGSAAGEVEDNHAVEEY